MEQTDFQNLFKGLQGPVGPAGPQGPAGSDGGQGPQGLGGPQGPVGGVGPVGPAGEEGKQGPVGPTGSQGPVGAQGPQGPEGIQGPVGGVGPAGPVGPTGSQGPIGPTGPQGPAGSDGADGSDGKDAPFGGWVQIHEVIGSTGLEHPTNILHKIELENDAVAGVSVRIVAKGVNKTNFFYGEKHALFYRDGVTARVDSDISVFNPRRSNPDLSFEIQPTDNGVQVVAIGLSDEEIQWKGELLVTTA